MDMIHLQFVYVKRASTKKQSGIPNERTQQYACLSRKNNSWTQFKSKNEKICIRQHRKHPISSSQITWWHAAPQGSRNVVEAKPRWQPLLDPLKPAAVAISKKISTFNRFFQDPDRILPLPLSWQKWALNHFQELPNEGKNEYTPEN